MVVVAGVGFIIVVAGGASVGYCVDIGTYLVAVECSWVVHVIVVIVIITAVSGALTSWQYLQWDCPQAVCQRRSSTTGQVGCPPYPGFLHGDKALQE